VAIVFIPDRQVVITEVEEIKRYLAGSGIEYDAWDLVPLDHDASSATILDAYRDKLDEVKAKGGYTSVDIVDVQPSTPGIDEMLARFNREHWHDEDEVRFTVGGRGLFHIHPADSAVVAIEVRPGDMIRVPRGTRHWFNLCNTREIKAIRFFQDKSGWTPQYTDSAEDAKYEPVCLGASYFPHSR